MPNKTGFEWTEDRLERLSEMWLNGLTGLIIANHLGCTRNAVIAKARRLGLKHGGIINPKSRPLKERFDHLVEMIAEEDINLPGAAAMAGIRFDTARRMWAALCNEMGEEFA